MRTRHQLTVLAYARKVDSPHFATNKQAEHGFCFSAAKGRPIHPQPKG